MEQASKKINRTLTDEMRLRSAGILNRIGVILNRLGFTPNAITVIGLLGNLAAGIVLATGHITWGGVIALIMAPFDALDGALARSQGSVSPLGAFIDSVADRYSEALLMGGLLIHFIREPNPLAIGLIFAAITGSLMVSYVKARAEGVGFEAKVGILTRLERMLVLIPCLLFNKPLVALWILALLTHFTAIQRVVHVLQAGRRR